MKKKILIEYDDETNEVELTFDSTEINPSIVRTILENGSSIMDQFEDNVESQKKINQIKKGTPVIAKYGHNPVLNKPFEHLYEFGYYTKNGCVVYKKGERNMQDALAFDITKIRKATDEEIKEIGWG